MRSTLMVDAMKVPARLGVTDEEQAYLQVVTISVAIGFDTLPEACQTDNLRHTVNYAQLCEQIKMFCKRRRFSLIEAMAHRLHAHLKQWLNAHRIPLEKPEHQRLWLSVRKTPPLADVTTCTFSLGDGHPDTW